MCYVLFSYACILIGQEYLYVNAYLWACVVVYRLFMMQNFMVCHHVSDRLGCATGEKSMWNTETDGHFFTIFFQVLERKLHCCKG
jgi:hypothetical protein